MRQPYLVEPSNLWNVGSDQQLFGTTAYDHPPLHALLLEQKERVVASAGFAEVFVFDALIANPDRTDANLLCDANKCFAFDHDQALFGLNRTVASLGGKVDHLPLLFLPTLLPLNSGGPAVTRIRDVATRWSAMRLDFDALDELPAIGSSEEIDAIKSFLRLRLSNLQNLAAAALRQGD